MGAKDADGNVVRGDVQAMFSNLPPAMPLVKDGKVRALAITADKRDLILSWLPECYEIVGRALGRALAAGDDACALGHRVVHVALHLVQRGGLDQRALVHAGLEAVATEQGATLLAIRTSRKKTTEIPDMKRYRLVKKLEDSAAVVSFYAAVD